MRIPKPPKMIVFVATGIVFLVIVVITSTIYQIKSRVKDVCHYPITISRVIKSFSVSKKDSISITNIFTTKSLGKKYNCAATILEERHILYNVTVRPNQPPLVVITEK